MTKARALLLHSRDQLLSIVDLTVPHDCYLRMRVQADSWERDLHQFGQILCSIPVAVAVITRARDIWRIIIVAGLYAPIVNRCIAADEKRRRQPRHALRKLSQLIQADCRPARLRSSE